MKLKPSTRNLLLTAASALVLTACGGSDDNDIKQPQMAKVSFAVSDAPVDSADQVVIAFDQIELVRAGQDNIVLDVSGENGSTFRQVDLLQYQGSDSTLIVSDQLIPTGTYDNLILHILDESTGSDLSFVVDQNGQIPLKQPSNKLQLGGFTVGADSVQAFTIEFDLRQSLVENQNGQRYNLKPHGVKILNNAAVATVQGTVPVELSYELGCNGAEFTEEQQAHLGDFVYLYQGTGLTDLGDLYDPDMATTTATAPYASAPIHYDTTSGIGAFEFGYLPTGSYTLAYSCTAGNDDPEQFDDLTIPNPSDQVQQIELIAGQNQTVTFTLPEATVVP
ncbi:DUF4382 domain-containing protein [Shewanella avicenniae]|uniref:DUF4382 domain-containing protein n=1 Tax=Shewanella avicenniae TaxID=2814294 RepID=A0ABX7QNU7_9GAMM|nr:DUF4382 domain-containing protein [Shewanella avicenniae]QSX32548.1 DUF4382 domain-containing protein [Shewanella avicenniae]